MKTYEVTVYEEGTENGIIKATSTEKAASLLLKWLMGGSIGVSTANT